MEGSSPEQWKQITGARAGWTMKPADFAPLTPESAFQRISPDLLVVCRWKTDADFNRAMGRSWRRSEPSMASNFRSPFGASRSPHYDQERRLRRTASAEGLDA